MLWRFGRFGKPELLRLEALGDVRTSSGEPAVADEDDTGVIEVTGDVVEVTDHDVLLLAGRRRVVVVLDGRAVLAAPGERATARGRLSEPELTGATAIRDRRRLDATMEA